MNKEVLTGQATAEQIKTWKDKYGDIFFTRSDGHIAYFRKPTRPEVSYSMSLQSDPIKASESILKACHIGGSDVFYKEPGFMIGASDLVEALMDIKKVELGKL